MLDIVNHRNGELRRFSTKADSFHTLCKFQNHMILQICNPLKRIQQLTLLNVRIAEGKGILGTETALNGCTGNQRGGHHKRIFHLTKLIGGQCSTPNGRRGRNPLPKGGYTGPVHTDHYGRKVPKGSHGTIRLETPTNIASQIIAAATQLFDRITIKELTVRRLTIAAIRVEADQSIFQVDMFTDTKKLEKEKKLQQVMLGIKNRYGKNAVLKGTNFVEGATMRERNEEIGGHKA